MEENRKIEEGMEEAAGIKTENEETKAAEGKEAKKARKDVNPDEAVRELSAGKLQLFQPFLSDNVEIKELKYNFENLTGPEMMAAMDRGARNGGNAFRITNEQALELFCTSAGKETENVDATDVRRGLGSVDAIKAVQLATVFFVASSQLGNAHITK